MLANWKGELLAETQRGANPAPEHGDIWLAQRLADLGVETWPTDANFLLARTGADTYDALLREGVIVRPLQGSGLEDCVRITVGSPAENERLVKSLRKLREPSS